MIQASYPRIAEETTTITFLLRGLAARPSLVPYIPTLLLKGLESIREARVAIELVMSAVPTTSSSLGANSTSRPTQQPPRLLWCEYHQGFGNHSTDNCRDRLRAVQRSSPTTRVPCSRKLVAPVRPIWSPYDQRQPMLPAYGSPKRQDPRIGRGRVGYQARMAQPQSAGAHKYAAPMHPPPTDSVPETPLDAYDQ